MKFGTVLLMAVAAMLLQSCTKDEDIILDTAEMGMLADSRSSEVVFSDVSLPANREGVEIGNAFMNGDTLYVVVNKGVVSEVVLNNTCVLGEDVLASGFVQNDTFRVKVPPTWCACQNGQLAGQTWDFIIVDVNIP